MTLQHFPIAGYYERSIENGIDPAHNEYVHDTHGFSGEREEEYKIGEMRIEDDPPWGRGFWHTFQAPPLPGDLKQYRPGEGTLDAGTGYHGTNMVWTFIHRSELSSTSTSNGPSTRKTPLPRLQTLNRNPRLVISATSTSPTRTSASSATAPRRSPVSNENSRCFRPMTEYRERQKEWTDKGWKIERGRAQPQPRPRHRARRARR